MRENFQFSSEQENKARIIIFVNNQYQNTRIINTRITRIKNSLKSAVFRLSLSLPPLVGGGGGLVCESVGKADLLSDHFDGKQSRESVDLPLTCQSPSVTSFAFRSSEVRHLLLDLDPYGGSDPLGMFPLFLKRTADVLAPHLSVVFWRLVRLGSFPACWRQANVTPIPKGPPSPLLPTTDLFL